MNDDEPSTSGFYVRILAAVVLACAVSWSDFYFFRVLEAFRDADPVVTLEAVWEGLTCAPQCAREW